MGSESQGYSFASQPHRFPTTDPLSSNRLRPLPYRCRRFSLRQTLQVENRGRMKIEELGDFLVEEVELEEEVEVVAQEKDLSTDASGMSTSLGKPAPVASSFCHNKTSNPRVKNHTKKPDAVQKLKPVMLREGSNRSGFCMASLPVSTTAWTGKRASPSLGSAWQSLETLRDKEGFEVFDWDGGPVILLWTTRTLFVECLPEVRGVCHETNEGANMFTICAVPTLNEEGNPDLGGGILVVVESEPSLTLPKYAAGSERGVAWAENRQILAQNKAVLGQVPKLQDQNKVLTEILERLGKIFQDIAVRVQSGHPAGALLESLDPYNPNPNA
ncbi:hypothetical protein FB446DRAFT_709041 [Lentinula raphanica]|nr:hypothetical protein FB446DRAFT_709041 [Lentinula raphanica]